MGDQVIGQRRPNHLITQLPNHLYCPKYHLLGYISVHGSEI